MTSPLITPLRNALLAGLAIASSTAGFAAAPPPTPPLPVVLAQARVEPAAIETIYNEAILRDGNVDAAVGQLSALAQAETQPRRLRTNALLVASHLHWRFGRLPAALEIIDRAIAIEASPALTLQKARLLEAAGKLAEARQAYEQTLASATDPAEKEDVLMRLTFLVTNSQNVGELFALAKTRDPEFRNRAAVALAILNRPAEAAELYEVFGAGSQRQRQHLRLAQWAVQARQAPKAQAEAWEAVKTATLSRDVRYSLSVLVEAHELDASWDLLLAKFAAQPDLSADAKAARVDVLHRLKRYDEAIALIEGDRSQGMSREGQRRLLRMYGEAGRHETLAAELRKLIAREPAEIAWPRGLSEHYLEQGRRDDAAKLWREFTERNDSPEVLLEGGRTMAQHGLDELALAAADKCLAAHPESATYVWWFRYEHHLKRGQVATVEEVLRQLEKDLPADSPQLPNVAEAYERIKNPKRAVAIWDKLAQREGGLGSEESMHLAWLYDSVGQRDKALALWKKLWAGEVSETRRKLVEDRLLLLAAEAGAIGDLAIPLEEKVAQGTATPKDSALLVRIYTDASDPASAIEVIQESFRRRAPTPAVEIASLQEQARVYQALNRHTAFIAITEKLLKLDPENASEYLQSLILNHLERGGKQDVALLQSRLHELRQRSATAGDEFEAGVLVMAGFREKGIDSYRRALARNPGSSDNYLLLADLLKQDRRIDQGTAILQYFAEIAPGDDGFMVAIDGILNLKPAADSAVLRWAHRRVLERITRQADKFYLYDLSAELSQESRDMKTYLTSLENSLVEAGPRRSTVLRELIAATDERQPGMSNAGGLTDLRRNLSFSRKLVAMGEDMPPEVYLNLGRTFLRMDNPSEALNAFNLAIDRTERASLVEESADRFESAGYTAEATVLYEKALTADTGNIGVMAKLAGLRSRDGAVELANGMYLRALLRVIEQQPLEVEPPAPGARTARQPDEGLTFLFKRYQAVMQSGLLFTLAPDAPGETAPPPQFAKVEAAFDQVLQEVLQRAGGRPLKPLASYPRLTVLAKLSRLSALHSGRYNLADRGDLKLLRHFGGDLRTVTELVTQRLAWGLRDSAEKLRTAEGVAPKMQSDLSARTKATVALAPLTDLIAAAQQALKQRNFELAADSAIAAGDAALTDAIYKQWMSASRSPAAGRAARGATVAGSAVAGSAVAGSVALSSTSTVAVAGGGVMMLREGGAAAGSGSLGQVAVHARRKLDPEKFAAISREIVVLAAENPEAARDLLIRRSSSASMIPLGLESSEKSNLLSVEEAAGKKVFSEEQLATAVAAIDSRQLLTLDMDYVLGRLPPAARGPLALRQLQAYTGNSLPMQFIAGLGGLLARPVDADSSARILTELKDRVEKASKLSPFMIRSIASSFTSLAVGLPKNFDRSNVGFLADLDRHLLEKYPDAFATGVFASLVQPKGGAEGLAMSAVIEGALRELAQLPPDYPITSLSFYLRRYFANYTEQIFPKRKAELLALLDEKSAEPGQSSRYFGITMAVFLSDPSGDPRETVAWLERLRQRQPDHKLALEALYPLYRQLGEGDRERETLERLIVVAPEAENYRQQLSSLWRALDHPENALRALGDRPRAAAGRDPNQFATAGLTYGGLGAAQVNKLVAQLANPDSGNTARPALRGLLQMLPAPGVQIYEYYRNGLPVIEFSSLFALGANPATARPGTAAGAGAPSPWLRMLESEDDGGGGPDRPAKLLERVATQPYALPELEAVLRTLDPASGDTDEQYLFYPLMAHAYASNGRMPAEFTRLTEAIQAGNAGKKDLLLWLEVLLRQPADVTRELLPAAEKAFVAGGPISDYQRIQLARLYARAGRQDDAVGIYSVTAISALGATASRIVRSDQPSLFSAGGLCTDAEKHLDPAHLAQFFARLAQIAKPADGPAYEMWHQRFVLLLIERSLKVNVTMERLQSLIATFDPAKARREDLVRFAQAQSRLLPVTEALPALRSALRKSSESQPQMIMSSQDFAVSRYATSLGFRYTSSGQTTLAVDPSTLTRFRALFPTSTDAWPNAREWIVRAAQAIPGWMAANEVEPDLALQVLALLTWRLQQISAPEAAGTARELSRLLTQTERVSTATATLVLAVTERMNTPLELAVAQKLVGERRVDIRMLAGLVRRVALAAGVPAALALGESALAYTRDDELLQALESLAEQAGNADQRRRFATFRELAAQARATLDGPKPTTPSGRISGLN